MTCDHVWEGTYLWHMDRCTTCGLKRSTNPQTKEVTYHE